MNKKYFIPTILLVLSFFIAKGQNTTPVSDTSDLSFEIFAAPGYYAHTLTNVNSVDSLKNLYDSLTKQRRKQEKGIFSFSAGISLNFKQDEHFTLQTGLWYSRKGFQGTVNKGFSDSTLSQQDYQFIYHYLEIPVLLKVKIIDNDKWALWANPGFIPQFALESIFESKLYYKNGHQETRRVSLSDRSIDFHLSVHGGFEVQYKINNRFRIIGRPFAKYMLSPVNTGKIQEKLHSFGIAFGVNYRY